MHISFQWVHTSRAVVVYWLGCVSKKETTESALSFSHRRTTTIAYHLARIEYGTRAEVRAVRQWHVRIIRKHHLHDNSLLPSNGFSHQFYRTKEWTASSSASLACLWAMRPSIGLRDHERRKAWQRWKPDKTQGILFFFLLFPWVSKTLALWDL
jgi:hypothetical protein